MSENSSNASLSLLDFAELVAETLEDQDFDLTEEIALQHAQQGDLDRAVEIAETISDPYLRDQTVGYIATFCSDHSADDFSMELLQSIEDPMMLEMAAGRVANRFAHHGKIESALEAAGYLADVDPALSNIAVTAVTGGFQEKGLEVISSIESPGIRSSALAQIILSSISQSPQADVDEMISEINSTLEQVEFDDEKLDATVSLATIYQAQGRNELALETFEKAHGLASQLVDSNEETSNFIRDVALGQIVAGFGRLKAFDRADQVLAEISDPFQFAIASVSLAMLYDREQHDGEINELLSQALDIGNEQGNLGENSGRQRDALFVELARAHASLANFEKALAIASSIDSSNEQLRALSEVAAVSAAAGDMESCQKAASLLDNGVSKVAYWLELNEVFRKLENVGQSQFSLAKATEEARAIEDPFDRSSALSNIGLQLSLQGDKHSSEPIFTEAITLVPGIETSFRKVKALLNLSRKSWTAKRELTPAEGDALSNMLSQLE